MTNDIITNKNTGFSLRWNEFLDFVNFPPANKGRYTEGARRFGIKSSVTFRSWCVGEKTPKSFDALFLMVESLLSDIPAEYDPHAVIMWLHGGDAVKHPFKDHDIDFRLMLDVSLSITDEAQAKKINLNRQNIEDITQKIYKYLIKQRINGLNPKNRDQKSYSK